MKYGLLDKAIWPLAAQCSQRIAAEAAFVVDADLIALIKSCAALKPSPEFLLTKKMEHSRDFLNSFVLKDALLKVARGRWITSHWIAEIRPSFHQSALIGVVRLDEPRIYFAAMMFTANEVAAIRTIKMDPLQEALLSTDLFEEYDSNTVIADGIEYSLTFELSGQYLGKVEFANPRTGGLKRLESAIFLTAQMLATRAPNTSVQEYLEEIR